MTDRKLPQPSDNTLYPLVSRERIDEVFRIFSYMGIHEQPSGSEDRAPYPRFKKLSFLKPHPYGIKVSDRSES